jgi:DNA repair protein RadC
MIFFIDNKQSVLSWHYLQEVCVFPDNLDKRTIMRMIMGTNTTHVILARNYIKGQTKLRKNDLTVALTISEMFRTIGVGLFDYIVVGRDRSYATLTGNLYMEPPIENKLPKVGDQ